MLTSHLRDEGNIIIVTVPDTKTKIQRIFTITDVESDNGVSFLGIIKKYMANRPKEMKHNRLFIYYKNGKCSNQPVGINTIGKFPRIIAEFLKLNNPQEYTGHCFRRSSASLLADSGADITNIKRHGGWKSTTVAEGYIESSIENKRKVGNQIFEDIAESSRAPIRPRFNISATTVSSNHQQILQCTGESSSTVIPEILEGIEVPTALQPNKGQQFSNLTNCVININNNHN